MKAYKLKLVTEPDADFFAYGYLKYFLFLFLFLYIPSTSAYTVKQDQKYFIDMQDSGSVKKVAVKKENTDKLNKKQTIKKSEQKDSNDLIDEDDSDDDIYSTYSKWRIDKFDNWGKHKKKNEHINIPEKEETDTAKVNKSKEFKDNDKETFLIYPGRIEITTCLTIVEAFRETPLRMFL